MELFSITQSEHFTLPKCGSQWRQLHTGIALCNIHDFEYIPPDIQCALCLLHTAIFIGPSISVRYAHTHLGTIECALCTPGDVMSHADRVIDHILIITPWREYGLKSKFRHDLLFRLQRYIGLIRSNI